MAQCCFDLCHKSKITGLGELESAFERCRFHPHPQGLVKSRVREEVLRRGQQIPVEDAAYCAFTVAGETMVQAIIGVKCEPSCRTSTSRMRNANPAGDLRARCKPSIVGLELHAELVVVDA